MPDNGNYDWRERMDRLEASVAKNWEEHERIYESIKDLRDSKDKLRDSNLRLHADVQNLIEGICKLIDRIPPGNLR